MASTPSGDPTRVIHGSRVSAQGKVRLGVAAVLLDASHGQVLLTRRSDNGLWCLPGGIIDPGESISETVIREMREETGLEVHIHRLIGVYSNPDRLIVYPDGNKAHTIVLAFEVESVAGTLGLSNETTAARYFPVDEAARMQLFHDHEIILQDTLAEKEAPFIR